ncbi:hypothetical protein FE782_24060 [Paenibacillus antri]|uniref:Uncharacterized protein n=1 Tax=Paenibacillus antri TaxID=2582848 RepID=A0A5R9GED4_9BACL|nr:hypothetical protein [Paenibacillus antri]TLS49745.1 hypothetical protein FE782_24060 [Paenibacillus antri]
MIKPFSDFDQNEWFLLISLAIAYTTVFRLPRLFPKSIALLIGLFSISLAKGADHTLGVAPLDYYDTNEIPVFDVSDFATWFLYPAAGYLYIYFYHRLRIAGPAIPVYVLVGSALGVCFELLSVKFQVFTYKEWNPGYSFIVYLLAQSATILFFTLTKHWFFKGRISR